MPSFIFSSKPSLFLPAHHLKIFPCSSFSPINTCKDLAPFETSPVKDVSKLITSYIRLNDISSAVSLFNSVAVSCNSTVWNLIIKSHFELGMLDEALMYHKRMRKFGIEHDGFTFPILIRCVSSLKSENNYVGMLHSVGMKMGFDPDLYFCNGLIDGYVKCGSVESGRRVFDEMPHRDLVSWTSMISGYVSKRGCASCGFELFRKMQMELEPNSVTVIVMLQACCCIESAPLTRQFHCFVIKKGFIADRFVQNSVLRMYTKMGCDLEVKKIFSEAGDKDVVTWNILISFYSTRGDVQGVTDSISQMQTEMISPGIETWTLLSSALAQCGGLRQGKMIHCAVVKIGLCDTVLQTSLLDLYAKCGDMDSAVSLFEAISSKTSITLSVMMSGYIQNSYFGEVVEMFMQIQAAGIKPGAEILQCLVQAYTYLGALQLGKGVHGYLIRTSHNFSGEDIKPLETSVLNMYIKCGSISSAKIHFITMIRKDIVAWTSMIEGLGTHGLGVEALKFFQLMLEEGILPNRVTFLSLLSACSHSGLVHEGFRAFHEMRCWYHIIPDLDHYTCVVDLLGRSGMLKEALVIILKMIVSPDSRVWGALLAASRAHSETKIGEYAAKNLLELEQDNVGYYTVLSNIHASNGRWDGVEQVRESMSDKELKKKPGWSCIEVEGRIHGFVSGDRLRDQTEEAHETLRCLGMNMKDLG